MAPPPRRRGGRYRWVPRLISALLIASFGLCMVSPVAFLSLSLRMRMNRSINSRVSLSCPSCYCDCTYQDFLPIASRPTINNSSSPDYVEMDPEMTEEMGKNTTILIKEELRLLKIVSGENIERYKKLIESVKKTSSRYQKDVEKCDRGVRNCERGRERAQEEFAEERRRTTLWRKRAQRLATP